MTHTCERCHRSTELFHCRSVDEYLCEECIDRLADEAVAEIKDGSHRDGPDILANLFGPRR